LALPQPARAGIGWCILPQPNAEKHSTNPKGFSPEASARRAARMRVLKFLNKTKGFSPEASARRAARMRVLKFLNKTKGFSPEASAGQSPSSEATLPGRRAAARERVLLKKSFF